MVTEPIATGGGQDFVWVYFEGVYGTYPDQAALARSLTGAK
jgi:hypothetical protein